MSVKVDLITEPAGHRTVKSLGGIPRVGDFISHNGAEYEVLRVTWGDPIGDSVSGVVLVIRQTR